MHTVQEAQQEILAAVRPLAARREALSAALDCVLAEDVIAPLNLPPWDNSAVDGYAVNARDLASAGENNPIHLRIGTILPAGTSPTVPLDAVSCARIFTGAPLPKGADAVVMQEDTRPHHEGFIAVIESVDPGENIRRAGEDVRAGSIVLHQGTLLGPAQLGMAAAVGAASLSIVPRPRIGVLVTGAEITEPGRPLQAGQIYDSNSYALTGWVRQAGAEPVDLGIADDNREDLHEKIDYALGACDAVITVGGVSVGEHDLVKDVLRGLGCEQRFWQVAMKPGKPFVFGVHGERFVFGLPGNPVSAAVTFLLLVRPALLRLRGLTETALPVVDAEAAEGFVNRGDRTHFMRAILEKRGHTWSVRPLSQQGSHMLSSISSADCLVEVPAESTVPKGATVQALRIR